MRVAMAAILGLGLGGAVACGAERGPESGLTIDREAFIATYVDLRLAMLSEPEMRLPEDARTAILDARDVTEEDLLQFVEVHGSDPDYMSRLWAEVADRMEQAAPDADTAA